MLGIGEKSMHFIIPKDRKQTSIMRPSLDEMIAVDSEVRILDMLVDQIVSNNRGKFRYKGNKYVGRKAYRPETMLKLYLYGYLNRISSCRCLEAECNRNIEVMWLLGDLRPDFKTIADYRKDNGSQIRFMSKQFRLFLKDQGYIKGKVIAVDGTKVKANASREVFINQRLKKRLSRMADEMEEYLKKLASNDNNDDESSGSGHKELVDKIINLEQEITRLKGFQSTMVEKGRDNYSPTDPDASLMKSRDGIIPAYNVQSTVDAAYGMIVDMEVVDSPEDHNQLADAVERSEDVLGESSEIVLADKGYYVPDEIEELEADGQTECYVPVPKTARDIRPVTFKYDSVEDEYTCSQGRRLVLISRNLKKRSSLADCYQGKECDGCSLRSQCTTSKTGRYVYRYHNQEWRDRYRKKMQTRAALAFINQRKALVEHPFGTLKLWMGKIPILLRGKYKVGTEMTLYGSVYNLRRLMNLVSFNSLDEMIKGYDWEMA